MFNSKEKISELGKTLWSLNETIGELRASCDLIGKALKSQEERIRAVESELFAVRADIKVAAAESREAAGDKATSVASSLIGSANGEIFTRLHELQNQLDALIDIDYSKQRSPRRLLDGEEPQKVKANPD